MECFLCLELDIDIRDCIQINSSPWDKLKIQSIIERHLWPMLLVQPQSQWLCASCWHLLHEFHNFYNRVEESHQSLLKIEPDPQFVSLEDDKIKDFLGDNLLEPEIIIDQNLTVVKTETEDGDSDDGDDQNDDDNIPLIHMRTTDDNSPGGSLINGSEECIEDPLNKITNNTKAKGVKRRKPKNVLATSPKLPTKNRQKSRGESSCSSKPKRDISPIVEDCAGPCTLNTPPDSECKQFERFYHESKVSVNEYDTFIVEYIKLNCDLCQTTLKTFADLQKHFDEVHEIRGYVMCCGYKYISKSLLVDHISSRLNPEYFKCPHCPEIPTLRKNFKAHMKLHDEELHSCDVCKKRFQNKYFLQTHKRIHVPEEERKFQCTVCDKSFATEPMLTYHQNAVHLKTYRKLCDICGATFRDVESLRRHMGKHDGFSAPPPLSCEVCGRLCANKRNLKIHMNSQHPVEKKEFICPVCSKKSPNAKALRQHVRVNHETGFIHKCSICEKAFKRAENLKSHMNIHTGTDLYHCAWCPKTFNANSSMHLHRKTAHPREWEEERRRKYSGNLPPNYKPPPTKETHNFPFQYHF